MKVVILVGGWNATITVTKPDGHFGSVKINESCGRILNFKEKSHSDQFWSLMDTLQDKEYLERLWLSDQAL